MRKGKIQMSPPSDAVASSAEHPRLSELPAWRTRTIAVLVTLAEGPFAIPVSASGRQ